MFVLRLSRWWLIVGLIALDLLAQTRLCHAQFRVIADHANAQTCQDAAAHAEAAQGLPAGLLLAIGRQESGRTVAETGEFLPWPFSINAAGEDHVFSSAADAVAYVAQIRASGVLSVDVGCFQINLLAHPAAFSSLEEAFDPEANARYAAQFLGELYRQTGSWQTAVAHYHSAHPGLGEPYMAAVLRRWTGSALPAPFAPEIRLAVAQPMLRREHGVTIYYPTQEPVAAVPIAAVHPLTPASVSNVSYMIALRGHSGRLPRVITP